MAFDTSYLYYRAFFGVPLTMKGPDGAPNNAVRGLLEAITRLIDQYSPDLVACAWDDDWRPAWRTALLPQYKANRLVEGGGAGNVEQTPDELEPQVPTIRAVLELLGIPVVGVPGYEADDVLASLAARHDGPSLVVSGDRDLFQLVDARTKVVYVARSVAKHILVDEAWVRAQYGIPADRYVDFAVLRGDPSDGLPGVRGIGEKSAAKLVLGHPSLDSLIAAALAGGGDLGPSLGRSLAGSADYIDRAVQVVRTVADLPVGSPARLPLAIEPETLTHLRDGLGLGGAATRIVTALSSAR